MIIPAFFGFISGIWVGSFLKFKLLFFIVYTGLPCVFFVFSLLSNKNKILFAYLAIALVGVLLGVGRIHFSNLYAKSQLDNFANQAISAKGLVVDEPDERESNVKLTVRLSEIIQNGQIIPVNEKILINVPLYPPYFYGDKVRLDNLTLKKPDQIDSSDGRVFDYPGYLKVRGIWYTSKFTNISIIENGHGSLIKTGLFKLKDKFTNAISRVIPEPESSLMAGLLLGTKQSLGKNLLSEFQRSGVSHVVVLSGYNIAIVAKSILTILKFLLKTDVPTSVQPTFLKEMFRSQTISFGIGSLAVVLFAVLSGGGASVWRAAIMVLVALFAKQTDRVFSAERAFGLAITLMLLFNPLLLVFDTSFELSVLATIGLVFVSPHIAPYLKRVTEKYGLREIISSTVATQIVVLPYLIYTTGILSIISLPVNILILGTVPLTMFLGFITGIVGLISLYLSFIPALFAYVLLWYQLTIVHIGATLSFGAITLPVFSPIILILIYISIFYFLFFKNKIGGSFPNRH